MQTQTLCDALLPLLTHSTLHDPSWKPRGHYGFCGQSCPCCRWAVGESFGECDACQEMAEICDSYDMIRAVSKLWHAAAKDIRAREADTTPRGLEHMPWKVTALIMAYTAGHVSTRNNMWYNNFHYINGTCGPMCNCCIAITTDLPGCWERNTYIRMKRVSEKFYALATYRAIRSDIH